MFCSSCGKKMSGQFRGGRQAGFRCTPCRRWVKAVPLWDEIQAKVREIVLQPDLLAAALKSRLDNGEAIARLEGELKDIQRKLNTLERAEERNIRLFDFTDEEGQALFSEESVLKEQARIQSERKNLKKQEVERQQRLSKLREAKIDADGVRRFLLNASANLDSWGEGRWTVLLEALNLKVVAHDDRIDVEISVPSLDKEESVTMSPTSLYGPRPIKVAGNITGSTGPPAAWEIVLPLAGLSSATSPTNRWGGSSAPSS